MRNWSFLLSIFLLGLFNDFNAVAHESGHGPIVNERGPTGGQLSSVIVASDSEHRRDAKRQFFSEAKLDDKTLRVNLFDLKMKPLPVTDLNAKLILFYKEDSNPGVFKVELINGVINFKVPKTIKAGELIFNYQDQRYVSDLRI